LGEQPSNHRSFSLRIQKVSSPSSIFWAARNRPFARQPVRHDIWLLIINKRKKSSECPLASLTWWVFCAVTYSSLAGSSRWNFDWPFPTNEPESTWWEAFFLQTRSKPCRINYQTTLSSVIFATIVSSCYRKARLVWAHCIRGELTVPCTKWSKK
jgi:hypothetical protein